jgi:Cu/Ag efflux protein CusF
MTTPRGWTSRARAAARLSALALLLTLVAACSGGLPSGKLYPIRGEVVSIAAARNEVMLKHEAIAGFMQAMTMPFPVANRSLLDGIEPGDRIEGVLLVEGARYALLSLAKVEAPEASPPAS